MRVKVMRVDNDYVENIRDTDELLDHGVFENEAECVEAERNLRERGIHYLSADTYLRIT